MVPLLLPVVLIIGVLFFYYNGKALKASAPDSLVSVTVGNKAVPNDSLKTDEESVELTFKAKNTDIFELSYDDTVSIVPLDEEGKETEYPQLDSSDLKKKQALEFFEARLKAEESTSSEGNNEDEATEQTKDGADKRLPYYRVDKTENKGSIYFELEEDQVQKIRITRLTEKEMDVDILSLKDTTRTQSIITFQSIEELKESDIPVTLGDIANEEINEQDKEFVGEPETDQIAINPHAISATNPFKIEVGVEKTTGLVPFDNKKEAGYDDSPNDDIVRTFDQVNYRVNLGISNIDEKYTSLRIRLDTELSGAWRKDTSGQVRQTAEVANGKMTDMGDGTKRSSRSSWVTLNKATGQAYFTETIETFGGVNKDALEPKFTVTIESATVQNGGTEEVNQVINGTIDPQLDDVVYISAKPLVDVKLTWTPLRMSNFEKTTGTTDKPYSMISNVGAYVQLKPLPGRADLTSIKGCTYPVGGIEYKLDQQMTYTNEITGNKKILNIGSDTPPVQVITYDGLPDTTMNSSRKFTSEFEPYRDKYQPIGRQGIEAPVGYTMKTYPPNQGYSAYIGVYDTGSPVVKHNADYSINISNKNYKPVSVGKNKWLLSGEKMASNAEPFSVVGMQVLFPYEYLEKFSGVNGNISYRLAATKISYEGQEQEINSKIDVLWDRKWAGSMRVYSAALSASKEGLSSMRPDSKGYSSAGDSVTAQKNNIWGSFYAAYVDIPADTTILYCRWNANSMAYDSSRNIEDRGNNGTRLLSYHYGVGRKNPNVSSREQKEIDQAYTWYNTAKDAEKNGDIAAIKATYKITDVAGSGYPRCHVPLKVVGNVGAVDINRNPNLLLTNVFNFEPGGTKLTKSSPGKDKPDYQPTTYDEKGGLKTHHSPSGDWGDTLYISPITIRPTITTNKKSYAPDEIVKWTVEGKVESASEKKHKVQFQVTIPKETQYTPESAKDHQGNPLPDPSSIVINGDGTRTLKWILDYMSKGSNYNPKVVFDTSIISSELNFKNNVADLNGKVIAEVCLEEDESVKDDSGTLFRTSTTELTVTNSGVIVVDKVVDKPYIESGNGIDPAKPTDKHPTDFTYTVAFKNHSPTSMENVRILDVLPYNGDGRGTNFNGSYSLVKVAQTSGTVLGKIWYTNNNVAVNTDPNTVDTSNGWHQLGSDMTVLKDAKAIMATYDNLAEGKDMAISLTLRPNGQKSKDKYVNAPSLNSHLNKHVQGVPCSVRVYGRDISGVTWYDDSFDGLIGNKSSGSPEEWAKDIPVKLYRTSLEVSSYKKELVKESLTGEKFIDSSGNSLKKTDANGKYLFDNLPEGNYFVEFVIGDKVVQREVRVTKQLVGADLTKNSKADKDSYQTPEYTQPTLSGVAGLGASDAKNHITDVNLGLIRPSKIRLFKYEGGSVIDDGDGKLSDTEKETGTPLSGAEFEIYEGNASTPFATETTDGSGYLDFVKLFPGEHTLIETKAPYGYELIKTPIKVMIAEGNQTVKVYQEDDKKTDLPFTGGNGPLLFVLLVAGGSFAFGFGYILWYYRTPKMNGGR